ncbi:MAG: hypothetical protein JWM04_1192 [Verrucomicrobiales bacterium]|nr:hypothetical protein [Verrucomicrobiales bacterium]
MVQSVSLPWKSDAGICVIDWGDWIWHILWIGQYPLFAPPVKFHELRGLPISTVEGVRSILTTLDEFDFGLHW